MRIISYLNFLFLPLLLWINNPCTANAQQSSSQKLDMSLTQDFRKMMGQAFNRDYDLFDSLMHSFKDRIKKDLATPTAFTNKFDSLSKQMQVVESEDKLLRVFSWDEISGGTWHDMAAFAQFKTASGGVDVEQLDTERESELGTFTDVCIYKIHLVTLNNKIHYLLIGYGTHGAGHHHTTAQIFSIEANNLIKCTNCFESGEDLVVESARSYKSELKYDPDTKKISYSEFIEDEDKGGFLTPTGKTITLKIVGGVFRK